MSISTVGAHGKRFGAIIFNGIESVGEEQTSGRLTIKSRRLLRVRSRKLAPYGIVNILCLSLRLGGIFCEANVYGE